MMKRRWLLGFVTVLMAVLLVACGSGSSAQKSTKGPVTITFWHRMTGNYNKALEGYIKTFNSSTKLLLLRKGLMITYKKSIWLQRNLACCQPLGR